MLVIDRGEEHTQTHTRTHIQEIFIKERIKEMTGKEAMPEKKNH